jgi:hypothetical protein
VAGACGSGACGTSTSSGIADAATGAEAGLSGTGAPDVAADTGAPEGVACAVPTDCMDMPDAPGPLVSCCINKVCIYGQVAFDALSCTSADVQLIVASNYDQSCETDPDCIGVVEGNFCFPPADNCSSIAAIRKSAYAQYQADVAKTNAANCRAASSSCLSVGPCCRAGACRMGAECSDAGSPPASEAGADAEDGSPE